MINPINRVLFHNLSIDFVSESSLTFLAVTRHGGAGSDLIFLWKPETGPKAVQILKDTSSDLETSKDIPLTAFPVKEVADLIESNPGEFTDEVRRQIIQALTETHRGPADDVTASK